jgi:hypothetical protein
MPVTQTKTSGATFLSILVLAFSIAALAPSSAHGQASVLMHHNDVARTGQNLNETLLTPANVNVNTFGKLFNQKVDGSIVGQSLYLPNVQLPNGTLHNVVFVTTQHDSVYAFDADNNLGSNAAPLWTVNYPKSVPDNADNFGCGTPGYTEIGIMGTPVIDPTTDTLYLVSKTIEQGSYFFRLHALDVTSGAEKFGGPTVIAATVQTAQGPIVFTASVQLQRPALLLQKGSLYIGFGSNGCDVYDYNGWLFAYSASTLQQQNVFIVAPQGKGGSLWGAGGGPAVDGEGFIYFSTANGTFDFSLGGSDFGDSMLKMNTVQNGFNVVDYFTPYDQATLDANDLDLGSGSLVVLPDQTGNHKHELVGGGKEGTLYLVDRDAMGEFNMATNMVVQQFVAVTPSIKTTPAYWNGNVYLSGQKDFIKMFSLSGGLLSNQPTSQTTMMFNDRGPSISVSANGSNNGILWAVLHGTPIMYAFDATNLTNELYDTTQALHVRDKIVSTSRFVVPTVVNGKVFVGGLTQLNVFGLLPSLVVTSGNNQTGAVATTLPLPLKLQATDAYTHTGIPNVAVTCKDVGTGVKGKLSNPTGVTDSSGNFSTNYTLSAKVKIEPITCTALGYATASFSETSVPGPAHVIKQSSGNKQSAPVNTPLPAPIVALVIDVHFNPIQGAVVTFTDNGKGGTFSSTTVATNASGLASTSYTTPSKAGSVKITAATGSIAPTNFMETVTAQ